MGSALSSVCERRPSVRLSLDASGARTLHVHREGAGEVAIPADRWSPALGWALRGEPSIGLMAALGIVLETCSPCEEYRAVAHYVYDDTGAFATTALDRHRLLTVTGELDAGARPRHIRATAPEDADAHIALALTLVSPLLVHLGVCLHATPRAVRATMRALTPEAIAARLDAERAAAARARAEERPLSLPAPERRYHAGQRAFLACNGEVDGAGVLLRAGKLTKAARYAFTSGQCHALAAAVHERTGWPVVGLLWGTSTPADPHEFSHILVRTTDGRLLDANGAYTEETFCGSAGWGRDTSEGIAWAQLAPVPATRLQGMLAGAEGFRPARLDLARSYVDSVLEYADGTRRSHPAGVAGIPKVELRAPFNFASR